MATSPVLRFAQASLPRGKALDAVGTPKPSPAGAACGSGEGGFGRNCLQFLPKTKEVVPIGQPLICGFLYLFPEADDAVCLIKSRCHMEFKTVNEPVTICRCSDHWNTPANAGLGFSLLWPIMNYTTCKNSRDSLPIETAPPASCNSHPPGWGCAFFRLSKVSPPL